MLGIAVIRAAMLSKCTDRACAMRHKWGNQFSEHFSLSPLAVRARHTHRQRRATVDRHSAGMPDVCVCVCVELVVTIVGILVRSQS